MYIYIYAHVCIYNIIYTYLTMYNICIYIYMYMHRDELYVYSEDVVTERVAKTNRFCLAVVRGPCQLHEFLRLFSCAFRAFHRQQTFEALFFWSHSPSMLNHVKSILHMSFFIFLLFLSLFRTIHISNISLHIQHPHPHSPGQTKEPGFRRTLALG